ncbi:MAG: hypothetical protein J6D18_03830, partial [Erysipelotrichaceae bacterium]|nr:hypothetical protein [Erysipelotrichaceae bacterium]
IIPFVRAVCISIITYLILFLIGQLVANQPLFVHLFGEEVLKNESVLSSYRAFCDFFRPPLFSGVALGAGMLSFLFCEENKGKLRAAKALLSLCFVVYLSVQGFMAYSLSEQLWMDMQTESIQEGLALQQQPVQQTYPNIVVKADENYYAQDIQEIRQAIDSMPLFLLKNCRNIYIMDTGQYEKAGEELKMDDPNQTAAFSYSGDMSIRIRVIEDPTIINTYTRTMAHELSHIYDFSQGDAYVDPSGCANSEEFMALYKAAPDSISEYGASSQYEFFAEAGGLYVTDPQTLAALNPQVYDYFDRLYGPQMNNP